MVSPEKSFKNNQYNSYQKSVSTHLKDKRGTVIPQPCKLLVHTNTFNKKPSISNYIDNFINMFHAVFKENISKSIKDVVGIEREKYEKRRDLGLRNLDENIEVDLIFDTNTSKIIL